MKISVCVGSLALVAAVLSSCQPKDEKNLLAGANGGIAVRSQNINPTEYNNMLAVTLDRTVEAMALVKAAMSPEYAEQQGLVVEEIGLKDVDKSQTVKVIKNKKDAKSKVSATAKFDNRFNHNIEQLEIDEAGQLLRIVIKADESVRIESRGYKMQGKKSTFFKSITVNDRIEIAKQANKQNSYLLTILKTEEASPAQNQISYVSTQVKAKLTWDGTLAGLNGDILVNAIRMNARSYNLKTGAVALSDSSSKMTINLGTQCAVMAGELNLAKEGQVKDGQAKDGQVSVTQILLNDSTVVISSQGYQSQAQPCESRPLVDLTRLL